VIKRLLIAVALSVVGAVILFIGAAMHGGMCHCSTAMYTLFPYGAYTMMTSRFENLGLLLIAIQFPLYVVTIVLVKGSRRKVIALLLIIASHVLAVSIALHNYCQSWRRCALEPVPSSAIELSTAEKKATGSDFVGGDSDSSTSDKCRSFGPGN
jgi:hypothetical protein